ncbi:hypothetical protein NKG94_10150 [Micromonospora sp. M12]
MFLPSLLVFAWGFGFLLLGVPVVVLTVVAVVVSDGVGECRPSCSRHSACCSPPR